VKSGNVIFKKEGRLYIILEKDYELKWDWRVDEIEVSYQWLLCMNIENGKMKRMGVLNIRDIKNINELETRKIREI